MKAPLWKLAFICMIAPCAAEERLVSSDAMSRTILGFRVSAAALQKFLPADFAADPAATGPGAGVNLNFSFAEGIWARDAEGKATTPPRFALVGVPVRKTTGEAGNMQIAGLTGAAPGVYGVYSKGTSVLQRASRTTTDGVTTIEENWDFKGDAGEAVQLQLQYVRGPVTVSKVDSRIYSGARPEFYRIYRYDQGADVLRGAGIGGERGKSIAFKATGGKFASLFDGSEQLINITSLPYFSRQVFLP